MSGPLLTSPHLAPYTSYRSISPHATGAFWVAWICCKELHRYGRSILASVVTRAFAEAHESNTKSRSGAVRGSSQIPLPDFQGERPGRELSSGECGGRLARSRLTPRSELHMAVQQQIDILQALWCHI